MPDEHVENIERALSYMRNARRSAVKELAAGAKANEHQRGTTDDNMDRLDKYQRAISSLLEAKADEVGSRPPSDTAVRSLPNRRYAEAADEYALPLPPRAFAARIARDDAHDESIGKRVTAVERKQAWYSGAAAAVGAIVAVLVKH